MYIVSILLVALISGCAKSPGTAEIASLAGFTTKPIKTKTFTLTSHQKIKKLKDDLIIYIEGDGYAWVNRTTLSKDPSPRTPIVIQLAAKDQRTNVAYLARPCQYAANDLGSICDPKFWSSARYSEEVIDAMNQAISALKKMSKAAKLHLIGYSGGASIAVLIAARRADIKSITTVAGNLDLIAMQKYHNTSPLTHSHDPLHVAKTIAHISQRHFVGAKDQVVPKIVAKNFVAASQLSQNIIQIIPKVSHNKGWVENWEKLLEYVP